MNAIVVMVVLVVAGIATATHAITPNNIVASNIIDLLKSIFVSSKKENNNFKEDLAMSESSNRSDVVTEYKGKEYMGMYQYGDARLKDYIVGTTKFTLEDVNTKPDILQDFKTKFDDNEKLQQKVMSWSVNDNNSYIDSRSLDEYIGQELNGVKITREGLQAGAHLGGKTGLRKFLESGMEIQGENDGFDGNTYVSDYIQKFSK
jgi:hypothetical protein